MQPQLPNESESPDESPPPIPFQPEEPDGSPDPDPPPFEGGELDIDEF